MTQQERRETTQRRLLEAAIDTIAEVGYVNASTTEIARRAGVSRGAQLHHFPTKADLVGAAVAHSMERRLAEYAALVEQVPPGRQRVDRAIEYLWKSFQTKDCAVWIEVAVAAGRDADLRPHVAAASELHRKHVDELFAAAVPAAAGERVVALLPRRRQVHRRPPRRARRPPDDGLRRRAGRADDIVDVMKQLAAFVFPVAVPEA